MLHVARHIDNITSYIWYESLDPADGRFRQGLMDLSQISLPDDVQVFTCGPLPFVRHVRSTLLDKGVPTSHIRYEVLPGPGGRPGSNRLTRRADAQIRKSAVLGYTSGRGRVRVSEGEGAPAHSSVRACGWCPIGRRRGTPGRPGTVRSPRGRCGCSAG